MYCICQTAQLSQSILGFAFTQICYPCTARFRKEKEHLQQALQSSPVVKGHGDFFLPMIKKYLSIHFVFTMSQACTMHCELHNYKS